MSTQCPFVGRAVVVNLSIRAPPAAPPTETTGYQTERGQAEGETGHCDDELLLLLVLAASLEDVRLNCLVSLVKSPRVFPAEVCCD